MSSKLRLSASVDREVLTGIAFVRHVYSRDEFPGDRLTEALSNITHRQLKVRAAAMRETQKGTLPTGNVLPKSGATKKDPVKKVDPPKDDPKTIKKGTPNLF